MMPMIFNPSSMQDSALVEATVREMRGLGYQETIYLMPLTATAEARTKGAIDAKLATLVSLADITGEKKIFSKTELNTAHLEKITAFYQAHEITLAHFAVPSPLHEKIPFQLALALKEVSSTIEYGYMFTVPKEHVLWRYSESFNHEKRIDFVASFEGAKKDILKKIPDTQVTLIGHMSVDNAFIKKETDSASIRKLLRIKEKEKLNILAGSTQPFEVDQAYLEAFLKVIATGKFTDQQFIFLTHGGIKEEMFADYMQGLLKICTNYPDAGKQFKILVTPNVEKRLRSSFTVDIEAFLLRTDQEISAADAVYSSDGVAQAVWGAFLIEMGILGYPVYSHDKKSECYLPILKSSETVEIFCDSKRSTPCSQKSLGVEGAAPKKLAHFYLSKLGYYKTKAISEKEQDGPRCIPLGSIDAGTISL